MIILNCSFTASKLTTILLRRNLRLHGKRCFANSTLRLPQFILMSVTVMKRAPNCSCKLTPKFSGPYLLTAKLHGNKFKLLDPNTKVSEVVHVNHLKKVSTSFTPAAVPSPHLLLIFLLHLMLALLTVTGSSRLSVIDQFHPPPSFPLQGVRPS